jgi:hypothetical protein
LSGRGSDENGIHVKAGTTGPGVMTVGPAALWVYLSERWAERHELCWCGELVCE